MKLKRIKQNLTTSVYNPFLQSAHFYLLLCGFNTEWEKIRIMNFQSDG